MECARYLGRAVDGAAARRTHKLRTAGRGLHIRAQHQDEDVSTGSRRAPGVSWAAAAAAAGLLSASAPAEAKSQARRHRRRIGEDEDGAAMIRSSSKEGKVVDVTAKARSQSQSIVARLSRARIVYQDDAPITITINTAALQRQAKETVQKAQSVVAGVLGGDPTGRSFHLSKGQLIMRGGPTGAMAFPLAGAAGLAAAAALIWWLFRPSGFMRRDHAGGYDAAGGYWIKDRSLGGREVYIAPPGEGDVPSGKGGFYYEKEVRVRAAAGLPPPGAAAAAAVARPLPSWWVDARDPAYVSPSARSEAHATAQQLLARMLLGQSAGEDLRATDMEDLQHVCTEAGATVDLAADNKREAVFRAGCDAALAAAGRGSPPMGAPSAPAYISGLAAALCVKGVPLPPTRAAELVAGAVAARVRATMLQCAAAMRAGDDGAALLDMASLASVIGAFPPDPTSPELTAVQESLLPRLGRTERKALLEAYLAAGGEATQAQAAVALGLRGDTA